MENLVTIELEIHGMSCTHCANTVEQALKSVSGVRKATVDLDSQWAMVTAEKWVIEEDLTRAVEKAGYEARIAQHAK
ncbi:MAG: heavy metal-associated domain-containing protein [Armatimonadia bacterium]